MRLLKICRCSYLSTYLTTLCSDILLMTSLHILISDHPASFLSAYFCTFYCLSVQWWWCSLFSLHNQNSICLSLTVVYNIIFWLSFFRLLLLLYSNGIDMYCQVVVCHHTEYSVQLVLEEEGDSWYQPVPCIQIDGQQFHKCVNIVGTLEYIVDRFCICSHSIVCVVGTTWKFNLIFSCVILDFLISVRTYISVDFSAGIFSGPPA